MKNFVIVLGENPEKKLEPYFGSKFQEYCLCKNEDYEYGSTIGTTNWEFTEFEKQIHEDCWDNHDLDISFLSFDKIRNLYQNKENYMLASKYKIPVLGAIITPDGVWHDSDNFDEVVDKTLAKRVLFEIYAYDLFIKPYPDKTKVFLVEYVYNEK